MAELPAFFDRASWQNAIDEARAGKPDALAELVSLRLDLPDKAIQREVRNLIEAPVPRRSKARFRAWEARQIRALYHLLRTGVRGDPDDPDPENRKDFPPMGDLEALVVLADLLPGSKDLFKDIVLGQHTYSGSDGEQHGRTSPDKRRK